MDYVVIHDQVHKMRVYGPMTQLAANLLRDSIEEQGEFVHVCQLEHSPARYHTTQVEYGDGDGIC